MSGQAHRGSEDVQMIITDTRTVVQIAQNHGGQQQCPHCGRWAIRYDVTHLGSGQAIYFNLRGMKIDFATKVISGVHKSCGKEFELANWQLL